jgi:hypothetical protein
MIAYGAAASFHAGFLASGAASPPLSALMRRTIALIRMRRAFALISHFINSHCITALSLTLADDIRH